MFTGEGNELLKSLEGLNRSFEADRPRMEVVLCRRLRHHRTDQVVSEDVRPDLVVVRREFQRGFVLPARLFEPTEESMTEREILTIDRRPGLRGGLRRGVARGVGLPPRAAHGARR